MNNSKRILVAPLDWGLGHATRCIPIIQALIEIGHEPVLATDGRAYDLLKAEFPDLELLRLKGYKPVYPTDGNMVLAMGRQLPRFLSVIAHEQQLVEKWVKQHRLDGIISDNRYGLSTPKVPSVFITHQVNIRMPAKTAFLAGPVAQLNQYFISRFSRCWVPDWPGEKSLAGELSATKNHKDHFHHIGPLSRLKQLPDMPQQYDLLILLSGPEPQRSVLEEKILLQLELLDAKVFLVQGITEKKELQTANDKLDICSYLTTEEMDIALASSGMVVSRSGYSTVMDLVATGKQALLIPTPGQTEQEYLATELAQKKYFYSVKQDKLNLATDLEKAKEFAPPAITNNNGQDILKMELNNWLEML